MTYIELPFLSRFREALLSDRKTGTVRMRAYGVPGDSFVAFDEVFDIVSVDRVRLEDAMLLWREEGADSPEEFIEIWERIHPGRGFQAELRVWLHRFKRRTKT